MMITKIKAECNWILTRDEKSIAQIDMVGEYFMNLSRPQNLNWQDTKNVVISYRREFETLCIYLMSSGIPDPQDMTVFRFITAHKFFESKKPKP